MSGGRTGDLCRFSLVCSVVLGFSSVLVLVFTFVFIQDSLCFVSVEFILLRFSWNVKHSLAFIFINFSISLSIDVLSWGGWFTFLCHISIGFGSHIAFNNFPSFRKRYIFCVLDNYFFFFLINGTAPWKGRVFLKAVRAFYALALIFHMICVTFATFATYLESFTYFFAVSKFLALKTSQGSWYKLLYPFYCVANSDFFLYWWFLKSQNVWMDLYYFIISANSDPSVFFYSFYF